MPFAVRRPRRVWAHFATCVSPRSLYSRDLRGKVPSVGRHALAEPRHRWSVAAAAVIVAAVAFLTAGAGAYPSVQGEAVCCVELVAAPPIPSARSVLKPIDPVPDASMLMSARAVARDVKFALPVGVASEKGLQVRTILVARAISAMFPEIQNIGGVRPDFLRWHPNGLALDVMIPNYQGADGKDLGDRIAAYALANADRFELDHVIWRQVLYMPGGSTRMMPNYGSADANHYTHVHIATQGDGYPTGREVYYFTSFEGPVLSDGSAVNTLLGAR